jgi:sugar O-acyltransferase (sialic acid O-acetyltransferase NeuD family)
MKTIIILGAGGFAREAYFHLLGSEYQNFVFVDESAKANELVLGTKRHKVINDWDFSSVDSDRFLVAVGNPKAKLAMSNKAISRGLRPAESFIHPRAIVQDAEVGLGGIITPGCIVTTNVKIGNYVLLNLNCTVGHDTIIGDFVTVNPGCHISGNTVIANNVLLGTGTAIRENIKIGDSIITGAQAAVVTNLDEPGTYVGVPARALRRP